MRFSFFLSTQGGSPAQCGLERGLCELGHQVSDFHNNRQKDFDVLVIFNQAAHTTQYAYPDFPTYEVPIVFVDTAEYGYFRRLPELVKEYANAFARGSMIHDTKNLHEQTRLKNYLEGRSFPYFLREFSKHLSFPANYWPIDFPLYHLSHCSDKPDRGDYLRRMDEVFVSWGTSHPWRWHITNDLRACSPKSEIHMLGEVVNGQETQRMEQSTYFNKLVRARCGVSFDGYGSSSFRMTEVIVRTLLLQGPLLIHMQAPLVDGETCVMFQMKTVCEECFGTNIAEKLREVLEDPERSFRIHENGYQHCMDHYTELATAKYFISILEKHDWSIPTKIHL